MTMSSGMAHPPRLERSDSDLRESKADVEHTVNRDRLIYNYIKGKLMLSCLVGGVHGATLFLLDLELWIVFGILTFLLNLVPTIGLFIAVFLPMPFVLLDPRLSYVEMAVAFFVPGLVGVISKDCLETIIIGSSTSLHPVALMLSIFAWGAVWGMTGMILAVPITAVARIFLATIDHPFAQWTANQLAGPEHEFNCDSCIPPCMPSLEWKDIWSPISSKAEAAWKRALEKCRGGQDLL